MIRLYAYNSQTFYEGSKYDLEEMYPHLRIEDKNAYWRERFLLKKFAYFKGIADEGTRNEKIEQLRSSVRYVKFYDGRTKSFLTGLLPRVIKGFKRDGVRYHLVDKRKKFDAFKPIKKFRFVDDVEIRPEQIKAVNAALAEHRGIIACATNAGKTEMAAAIIAECTLGTKVLFLVHRMQLVIQTTERFRQHLDHMHRVAYIGGGKKDIPNDGVLVASVQTATNMLGDARFQKFLEECDILFIDEFHLNKAWTCSKIAKECLAPMRFGLSGTIRKKDKAKMMHYKGMTGPIIARVSNEELVNLGRSAKPIARFIEVKTQKIPKRLGYRAAYNLGIVNNEARNDRVIAEILRHLNKERKVLVTVSRIKHGHFLKTLLESKIDLPVEFLSGSTPIPIRNKVIDRFQKGKVSVIIASPIFDVGVDIPEIDGWVNAAGGIGWELVLQRLGRVLRKKEGANRVYISDFVDTHNKYLFKHSMGRIKHYQEEKIVEIKIVGA